MLGEIDRIRGRYLTLRTEKRITQQQLALKFGGVAKCGHELRACSGLVVRPMHHRYSHARILARVERLLDFKTDNSRSVPGRVNAGFDLSQPTCSSTPSQWLCSCGVVVGRGVSGTASARSGAAIANWTLGSQQIELRRQAAPADKHARSRPGPTAGINCIGSVTQVAHSARWLAVKVRYNLKLSCGVKTH